MRRQGNACKCWGEPPESRFLLSFSQVKHIMILGHKNCGGVKALMTRTDVTKTTNDFIDK